MKTVNKREKIASVERNCEDMKKDLQMKFKNFEEAPNCYISENDLKNLRTEIPVNWKYLGKNIAYPFGYFDIIDDYQTPVFNLKADHFLSKLKNA